MYPEAIPTPTRDQRLVLFGAALAQCEDIHCVAWSLTPEQCEQGEHLLAVLEAHEDRSALALALMSCLAVLVHDIDHPDLPDEQWDALEALLGELKVEFEQA